MTLSFLGYELGNNSEIQTRLQEEIDQAFEDNGGKIPDYTTIQGRVDNLLPFKLSFLEREKC